MNAKQQGLKKNGRYMRATLIRLSSYLGSLSVPLDSATISYWFMLNLHWSVEKIRLTQG